MSVNYRWHGFCCTEAKSRAKKVKPGTLRQRAEIEMEARKLAQSGKYRGFAAVQAALLAKGFPEAVSVFRNLWTCSEIDRLCGRARQKQSSAVDT
jgi:hypothetical protein